MNNEITTSQAFNQLKKAIQTDPDFSWSWHCTIAMCSYDEGLDPEHANKAAARFMRLCFGLDMNKHPLYNYKEKLVNRQPELVKYKHVRDGVGTPVGTICFCTDPKNDKKVYVGVTICAEGDNFSRKIGREISFARAVRAFEYQSDSMPISEMHSYQAEVIKQEPIIKKHPYMSFIHNHKEN